QRVDGERTCGIGELEPVFSERLPRGGAWNLGVIPDMREVNGPTVAYYAARRDLPVTVVQLVNRMKAHVAVEVGLDPFGRGDFYQTFLDYVWFLSMHGTNDEVP